MPNRMANIRKWIEAALTKTGESLEAVVVGRHYDALYGENPLPDENVVLPPEVALAKLDVDFDCGYGGADCFPMFAWTKSRIYFIGEYDGATGLKWVPRNPQAIAPEFSGQCEE